MKNNILYISGWYPTRMKPTLGNFVRKHAECASLENNVRALHVCTDVDAKVLIEKVSEQIPFPSTVIYIAKNRCPVFGKILTYVKIIRLYLSEFEKMVEEGFSPNLVHANVVFPIGIIAWLYHKKFGVNYVISEHWTGYHDYAYPRPNFIQRCVIRKVANQAKYILPVSDDLGKSMRKHRITAPMATIPNVVDTNLYTPKDLKNENSLIKMIHVSTLENIQKNITLLLQAFAKISQNHSNVELNIITDGNLIDYSEQIQQLKIGNLIVNHGRQDVNGVSKILQEADIFLLTSNFENLPCVLIESISCGVPVVATNVGGVSEIVNSRNGILVSPNNLTEFVSAIEKMIEIYNTFDKQDMHQSAIEKYSYRAIGNRLTDIYNECILIEKPLYDKKNI